jgi:hypothetical protein
MSNLAYYYKEQKDYDNMKKYYCMAISNGCTKSMNNLAYYYKGQKDYENMIKYYLMAGINSDTTLLKYVVDHYITLNDYDNIMNYFWIGFEIVDYIIIKKVIRYLLENNNMENIMEIYTLLCNDTQYEDYLEEIRKIINIKQIQYEKYVCERYIKLYKNINKYINCDDISILICKY